ncbi:MAG TPA: OmpA family protein [Saprospiraceae bacterium]|nr:OmpA family protein [Saprospiraceae bacterium]
MTAFIILLSIILLIIVILQISRLTELYARIRGEEEIELRSNRNQGRAMLLFMVGLLVLCVLTAYGWKNYMMGYGPHASASAHGGVLDSMFNVTLFFTGIVFVLTHIALFYFAWRYKKTKGSRGTHWPHNNTLEIIWSAIPAVVMTYLVIKGLLAWNTVMADVEKDEDHIEIEATGYQFAWHLRYPGPDGVLGRRNYKLISPDNPLGQDWTDPKNFDDFHPDELWLPVNKKVRVRIIARDVLHNFYLPHFRVKMDAVPGLPTYFVFTPTKTTEEYREELRDYPEYNKHKDPDDPTSPLLWEEFNYELACAELCGKSHYSMRRIVRIVSEDEYNVWLAKQQSYYLSNIRGKLSDPHRGMIFGYDKTKGRNELGSSVERALGLNLIAGDTTLTESATEGLNADKSNPTAESTNTISLEFVQFDPEKTTMTNDARAQLLDLAEVLKKYPKVKAELGVHTDNQGNAATNQQLSQRRADAARLFLIESGVDPSQLTAVGYGSSKPIETGDTDEARQKNKRTEIRIIAH